MKKAMCTFWEINGGALALALPNFGTLPWASKIPGLNFGTLPWTSKITKFDSIEGTLFFMLNL